MVSNAITHGAYQLAGGNEKLTEGLANAGNNLVAAAVGGGVGSAAGDGFANGAAISSTIEEYNMNFSRLTIKRIKEINKEAMAVAAVAGTAGAVIGSEVGTGAVEVVGPGVAATAPGGAAVGGALGAIGGYLLTAGSEIVNSVVNGDDESPSPTIAPPQGSNASNTEDNGNVGNKNKDQAPTAAAGGAAPPPDGNEPPDDHNNNDNKDNANSGNNSSSEEAENGKGREFDDLLEDTTPGRETKGRTKQYEKQGGFEQAEKDFNSLDLNKDTISRETDENGTRIIGQDKDGNWVNVRTNSSDGRATLEKQVGKSKWKIRYDP